MHGWTQPASDYDEFCTHLASWGFVVVSNNTETGIFIASMLREASDTRSLMQWVEDGTQNASSWLHNMTDLGDWGTCGHSMGGGAVSYLVREEARVRVAVMFEPYQGGLLGGSTVGFGDFDNFTGDLLVVAGTQDLTNNWSSTVRPWYTQASGAGRRVWYLIQGGDHFGSTDWAGTNGSLSGAEQHRLHRRSGTGFLRAELRAEENLYDQILGAGSAGDPATHEAAGDDPPLWAVPHPTLAATVRYGSFGGGGMRLRFGLVSPGRPRASSVQTPGLTYGSLRLVQDSVAGPTGLVESVLTLPGSLSGTVLSFQAVLSGGLSSQTSRVAAVIVP
jgi:dienelactone hydrolase